MARRTPLPPPPPAAALAAWRERLPGAPDGAIAAALAARGEPWMLRHLAALRAQAAFLAALQATPARAS